MRRLSGSIISTFAGWSAGLLLITYWHLVASYRHAHLMGRGHWIFVVVYAVVSAVFVFSIWAVLLVPLCFLVPRGWFLWRWPVCTLCGALSGVGLLLWYHHVFEPQAMIGSYVIVAAVIGGVTCFTGSMTRNQFSDDRALAQPTAEESKN